MNSYTELHRLVNDVLNSFLPLAVSRKSFIVNDVTHNMKVYADKDILALVFGDLIKTTLTYAENDCIRVSANYFSDTVFLNVKETSQRTSAAMAESVEWIQHLAEKLGGCITVNSNGGEGASVSLSFYNASKAA